MKFPYDFTFFKSYPNVWSVLLILLTLDEYVCQRLSIRILLFVSSIGSSLDRRVQKRKKGMECEWANDRALSTGRQSDSNRDSFADKINIQTMRTQRRFAIFIFVVYASSIQAVGIDDHGAGAQVDKFGNNVAASGFGSDV
uniref:Uncharacterized protein n=1 Tax=Romanomermis culicivorax TaxID=13658 RepID=A0A915J7Q6_ROMCU